MAAAVSCPQVQNSQMHQRRHYMFTWAACVGMPQRYVDVVSPCEEAKQNSQGTKPTTGGAAARALGWLPSHINQSLLINLNTYCLPDGSPSQASMALIRGRQINSHDFSHVYQMLVFHRPGEVSAERIRRRFLAFSGCKNETT